MLPYLEITHAESHCHLGLCLIMLNILWKLFGLNIRNVMSVQVGGKKLMLGTSCRHEKVNCRGVSCVICDVQVIFFPPPLQWQTRSVCQGIEPCREFGC